MPIDPSIALGVKPIQLENPIEQAGRAMTLRQLAGNQQIQQMQLDAARREQADEQALNAGFQQWKAAGGDPAKLADFAPNAKSYQKLTEFGDKRRKANADAQNVELETQLEGIKVIRESAAMANDQATWDQARARMGRLGESMPAQFDPKFRQTLITKAEDAAKQLIPKIDAFNTGKKTEFVDVNPVTNPGITQKPLTMTTTPGQDQSNATTIRGQNMVDARMRETNQVTREAAGGQRLNAETQAMAKFIDSNALPSLITSGTAVDQMLQKYEGKGIPGTGRVVGSLPPIMLTAEGKEVRSKLQAIGNDLLKLYSGGAVTANEAERRATEMMASGQFTDDDLRKAWPLVRGRINASIQNVRGGFSPEAIAEYETRGGIKIAPIGKAPAPKAPALPPGFVVDQ